MENNLSQLYLLAKFKHFKILLIYSLMVIFLLDKNFISSLTLFILFEIYFNNPIVYWFLTPELWNLYWCIFFILFILKISPIFGAQSCCISSQNVQSYLNQLPTRILSIHPVLKWTKKTESRFNINQSYSKTKGWRKIWYYQLSYYYTGISI